MSDKEVQEYESDTLHVICQHGEPVTNPFRWRVGMLWNCVWEKEIKDQTPPKGAKRSYWRLNPDKGLNTEAMDWLRSLGYTVHTVAWRAGQEVKNTGEKK